MQLLKRQYGLRRTGVETVRGSCLQVQCRCKLSSGLPTLYKVDLQFWITYIIYRRQSRGSKKIMWMERHHNPLRGENDVEE